MDFLVILMQDQFEAVNQYYTGFINKYIQETLSYTK